jgi:hypothetical protein
LRSGKGHKIIELSPIQIQFFGKFYEGGGKALEPLKTEEKYIYLKNKKEA